MQDVSSAKNLTQACSNMNTRKFIKVISVNAALAGISLLTIPFIVFKAKYGEFSLSASDVKRIAGGATLSRIDNQLGFKDAIKSFKDQQVYCNQPHPIIGWIDICKRDSFWGFSKITQKQKPKSTYRLLLLGGSVGNYIEQNNLLSNAIRAEFKKRGNARTVEIFNAALPGFKQPQQVGILNALLSSGWEFSSAVNIAGNNEIAFPMNHLYNEGYNSLLPYAHPERSLLASKMLYKPTDECSHKSIWDWHPLSQYIKIRCYREKLKGLKTGINFQPYLEMMQYKQDLPENKEDALSRAIRTWQASGRSLHAIALANNMDYLEVIQPSQYLTGSKVFTKEEKSSTLSDPSMEVVGHAFSRLDISGFRLNQKNILDARFIFIDIKAPTYIDNCCHLNNSGNTILAHAIAKKLVDNALGTKNP